MLPPPPRPTALPSTNLWTAAVIHSASSLFHLSQQPHWHPCTASVTPSHISCLHPPGALGTCGCTILALSSLCTCLTLAWQVLLGSMLNPYRYHLPGFCLCLPTPGLLQPPLSTTKALSPSRSLQFNTMLPPPLPPHCHFRTPTVPPPLPMQQLYAAEALWVGCTV